MRHLSHGFQNSGNAGGLAGRARLKKLSNAGYAAKWEEKGMRLTVPILSLKGAVVFYSWLRNLPAISGMFHFEP